MIRPNAMWRTVAVLGVAGVVLAGCGDDSSDEGASATPTTEETAQAGGGGETSAVQPGDGTFTVGTLLPQTGSLAFLGPPEFAGVQLAINDINAAGGVLGKEAVKFDSDSGDTSTDIASQSVGRLLGNDVDVIVGAASSGVSFTVIDQITQAGVVHFSPANTSPDFTTYADKGLYFRTAPSDVLQGRVLGDVMLGDGNAAIGILALQDPYGTGLADNIEQSVTDGGGEVVAKKVYDPKAADFSADVSSVLAEDPDAIALVSFDEAKKIVPELQSQGYDMSKVYFVDGNLADYSADFQPGTLEGAKGTLPGAQAPDDFRASLLEVDPQLKDYSYAAESYDATVLSALAAIAAENDSGTAIASELVNVSREGEKCETFADCKELLEAGTDIDYDGISGPIEFSDAGDPTQATIGVYQYGPDNKYTFLEAQEGTL
ncbi:ABC transporter substrate-binding protein [Vallicoccus soli]|uniref:Amino acid ABC transporter substrate-binding protein n=1 Tax=Vallicoccus soli TaxID=2339232 RepID=A0A3A3YSS8_9ACTN|nr:ABC transporter substrate-binding protein [Vallicoccus soli]RJK93728.1 amino acid ABC transporter substrate-binding protein [Vallicoccus soli]